MSGWQIALIVAAVLLLGLVLLPAFNRWQVRRMPADQQILLIMKQAKGLHYIRNVSGGKQGFLYYVKNKRKILVYPWVRRGRVRVITKKDPFDRWDYPEEQAPLTREERARGRALLRLGAAVLFAFPGAPTVYYARRSNQRIVWNDKTEQ